MIENVLRKIATFPIDNPQIIECFPFTEAIAQLGALTTDACMVGLSEADAWRPQALADLLLEPTRIYAKQLLAVLEKVRPQQIYHLAAISNVLASSKNPRLTYDVNVGGTTTVTLTSRYKDSTPGTPVAGLGPWGNAVTVFSSALNSASVNHADLTGGATSAKGVRLVASTGTVANGGAVIGASAQDRAGNTGTAAGTFVVMAR